MINNARLARVIGQLAPAHAAGQVRETKAAPAPAAGSRILDALPEPMTDVLFRASGMDWRPFARLCDQLAERVPFFTHAVRSRRLEWWTAFFTGLGERLATCKDGEAVAAICYHPQCYGDVTHISVMAITPAGDLTVNHQESITVDPTAPPVRNFMQGTLGIACDSYVTHDWLSKAEEAFGREFPDELPVMRSFRLWGEPKVMFSKLGDYAGARRFTEGMVRSCEGDAWKKKAYAPDADAVLRGHGMAEARGESLPPEDRALAAARRRAQPADILPPGAERRASDSDYSNSCTLTTQLFLYYGKCEDLHPDCRDWISPSLDLATMLEIWLRSRLIPDTPDDLPRRARAAWGKDGDEIRTKSFLIIGCNQARHPGKGVPPHIPCGEDLRRRARDRISGASPALPPGAAGPSPRLPLPTAGM